MKKIITILILLLSNIYAEQVLGMEKEEFQKTMFNNMIKGMTLGNVDLRSKEKKEKEKCVHKWWEYFKSSSHTIAMIEKDNRKIKLELTKHNLDYHTVLRQRKLIIHLDNAEMKKQSCDENYFNQLIQKEKRIQEVAHENKVLKEIAALNGIETKEEKSLYKRTIIDKPQKKEKKYLKIEMQEAIADVK